MGQNVTRVCRPSAYYPTTPKSGDITDNILYRMSNCIIKGRDPQTYIQAYAGSLSLSQAVTSTTITGTVALSTSTAVVTGSSTRFLSELHIGQRLLVIDAVGHASDIIVVKQITDDTHFTAYEKPTLTISGKSAYQLPVCFPLNQDIGTLLVGNAKKLDKGTILIVGKGTLNVNGSALTSTITATKQPHIGIFYPATNTYSEFPLGMLTPTIPVVTAVSNLTVASATNANPVVFTTTANHHLISGVQYTFSGGTGAWVAVNGVFTVTVISATTLSIPVNSTGLGALAGTVLIASSSNMQAGNYGIRIGPGRVATGGFNNAAPSVTVALTTGQMAAVVFPAADATNGQDAWPVWVTLYTDSLGADLGYIEGPWRYLTTLTEAQVVAAGNRTINLSWIDAQIARADLLEYDNDPPPDSEFVEVLNGIPVWISNEGPGYTDSAAVTVAATSPGPFIVPAKFTNVEAAPLVLAFSSSPPYTIIGYVSALGRLYLCSPQDLQIAQGTPDPTIPIILQPFWTVGFTGPNQVCFVNDTLYGASVQGPARSASTGDKGSQEFEFAAPVSAIVDEWYASKTLVAYDPQNNAVCYFHSGNALNSSGFWTTRVLMFGLRQDRWIGDITLSSTTGDMLVSSACMIGQRLIMLAGGRQANDSVAVATLIFDEPAGTAVSYYAATQYSDQGDELRSHTVKRVRETGQITSGSIGVFGYQPTEVISATTLEGPNSASLTGAISITTTVGVAMSPQFQTNCANLTVSAIKVEGIYSGTGTIDSIHEIIAESAIIGVRR